MSATTIIWRDLPGNRAIAPYIDGERQPFTVCRVTVGGVDFFEAWSRPADKWTPAKPIQFNLPTEAAARALVEREIRSQS
jgi:hypothetical protein